MESDENPEESPPTSLSNPQTGKPVPDIVLQLIDLVKSEDLKELENILMDSSINASEICNDLDSNGWTAFTFAVEIGSLDVVELFLKYKINADEPNFSGNRPIHCACSKGDVAIARVLLDTGVDVNAVDNELWQPIHYASEKGDIT